MASSTNLNRLDFFGGKSLLYRIALSFFFLFAMSISTSKAGMNVSASMLAIISVFVFLFNIKKIHKSRHIKNIFNLSLFIYFAFAFSSFFHPNSIDLKEYLYKNLYLLVIPIATFFLAFSDIRKKAIILFVISSFASALYSIYNFVTVAEFNVMVRTSGFLSSDRHLNAVIFSSCICLHYLFKDSLSNRLKILAVFMLLTFLISLIVSSTRGGWLAGTVSISFLILRFHRRFVPHVTIIFFFLTILFSFFGGGVYKEVSNRFSSITNISTDYSNTSRINMWKGGMNYLLYLTETQPTTMIFGGGMNSSASNYFQYLEQLPEQQRLSYGVDGERLGGTDFHMTFIDMSVKSGVLFTLIILSLFTIISIRAVFSKGGDDFVIFTSAYLLGVFLWLPFYSIMQGYSAYIFTFAIAIVLSESVKIDFNSGRANEIQLV
ncbi:hypothetical protein D515_01625 [Grimontia indica]|uniref:O-antigen ligase-related domain-containing protein n=1 Tax=Grimontia indica TaxID=1056512 RepID=R1H011_9GAMM|nr:O-antigen ligase family protein [Grimontia indica]EOD81719.1 hypothetical protein D515_01625 [Grimontia indica]